MLCYVIFGGMLATTWVQIIKAVLLMIGIVVMSVVRARAGRLEPDRAVQQGGGQHDRRVDVLARAGHLPGVADRHRLARARARARDGGPAAHPDAVLHRPGRQGRPRLGRLGDVHHRLLLPADDVHRLRRARRAGRGRRGGGRHRRQPRGAEPGRRARRRRRDVRRRPVPRRDRGRRLRDDPRGRRGARAVGVGRGRARHLVEHRPQGPRLREGGGRRRPHRGRRRSASSRSRSP